MALEFNLGRSAGAGSSPKKNRKFRLAVLGDFSARANRGELESGDDLSGRKTLKVEADNIDDLLSRLSPTLQLALPGSGNVELEFSSMEDFHPDQLYDKLDIFSDLSGLRQRLKGSSSFAKAADELRAIGLKPPPKAPRVAAVARGTVIAKNATLNDFLQSVDRTAGNTEEADPKTSLDAFLHKVMGPHITKVKNPQQEQFVAVADEAISAMMREVLHHPDFQALESLWRSLAFLAERLETDETLQITMIDMTAEEFAADLATDPENGALYRLLVEAPAEDERAGPFSAIVGNYVFERTPAHADLLGRIAKIVAKIPAPFIASVPANSLDGKPDDLPNEARDAWDALRAMPEAGYLALGLPRFMLRWPYGKKTDPIESFKFEEFNLKVGLKAMLWGNPAVAVGLLLAQTFRQQGDAMWPGSVSGIGEMPYYTYTDADGDQTALPCTERFFTARVSESIASQGFLPLLAVKNSPEIRVGIFRSVGGDGLLAGWWTAVQASLKAAAEAAAAAEAEAAASSDSDESSESTDSDSSEDSDSTESSEETSESSDEAPSGDADLDSLLAGLSSDSIPAEEPAEEAEGDMDPDLAKLLKDLG